jgi:hypothetical protein
MWANLLANAAGGQTLVTTAFVDILKSLSFDEAVFLTMLFSGAMGDSSMWNLDPVQYGNLRRLGLIMTDEERSVPRTAAGIDGYAMRIAMGHTPEELCHLTDLGMAFISACTAPKPNQI